MVQRLQSFGTASRAGRLLLGWSSLWLLGSGCAGQAAEQAGPQPLGQIAAEASSRGEELDVHLRETFQLLQTARADQDEPRLRCLDNKLTLLKGLLDVAHQAVIVAQDAASRGQRQRAELGLTKVRSAQARVHLVRRAVEACPEETLEFQGDDGWPGAPLPEAPGARSGPR